MTTANNSILLINPFTRKKMEICTSTFKVSYCYFAYHVLLNSLGDIALFYASGEYFYALSNPRRWGYESNSLHVINLSSRECIVCFGNDNELPDYIRHDRLQPPTERP